MSELRDWRSSLLFITCISRLNWMILKSLFQPKQFYIYNSWNTWLCTFFLGKPGDSPFLPICMCLVSVRTSPCHGVSNWDRCDRGESEHLQTKPFITGPSTGNFMLDKSSLMGDPAPAQDKKSGQRGKILGSLWSAMMPKHLDRCRQQPWISKADPTRSLGCVCEMQSAESPLVSPKISTIQNPAWLLSDVTAPVLLGESPFIDKPKHHCFIGFIREV